jgi:LEA14-like dessication related protein
MKLNHSPFFSALLLLTILLLGCSTPKELEYRDFKNFSIQKVGFASSAVKMEIIYYNPNNFGLQLKQADLDIFINDYYLGHTVQEYQVTIPRKMEFSVPIQMDVDMKNLFINGLSVLFNKEVTVKATGHITAGKANFFMNIPVNYEGLHSLYSP